MPLPRSVARFNRKYWNKVARHFAGWLPGFGIVIHSGRRSGRIYETPVNVFRTEGGFVIALTYGRADWVQNVMAAGTAKVLTLRTVHEIGNPRIVSAPEHEHLPFLPRKVLARIDVPEELHVDTHATRSCQDSEARTRPKP
jgi:deazaflavin-dependent oxidoreductase (nitroreductase family)